VAAHNPAFRCGLALILTDRVCGAVDWAASIDVTCETNSTPTSEGLSDWLLDRLEHHRIDYAFLFFTRMLKGRLVEAYSGRLVNFHPSLLPAHPGLRGFEDSVASSSPFIGTTAHLVDSGMDTGPIIMQTVVSRHPNDFDQQALRHRVFLAQCAELLQVFNWLSADRLRFGKRVLIDGAAHPELNISVPALEQESANLLRDLASPAATVDDHP
jgi:phosphoribosylglycinamide formyltransferase 1